jgi:hypothetical protein
LGEDRTRNDRRLRAAFDPACVKTALDDMILL